MHLICVTGPPAVGKMTVGRAVCDLTGFRLFHNHMSIEPLLGVYDFGTPSFQRINAMIRREVIAESVVAGAARPRLHLRHRPRRPQATSRSCRSSSSRWSVPARPIDVVELYAPQHVRLAREGGADRMDHKRSKRDVEWARAHVVDLESRARFNTDPSRDGERLLPGHRHLRLDNDHANARATAERIVTELGLPRL